MTLTHPIARKGSTAT